MKACTIEIHVGAGLLPCCPYVTTACIIIHSKNTGQAGLYPLFINECIFCTYVYYFSSITKCFIYLTHCISDVGATGQETCSYLMKPIDNQTVNS
jgi:hypothetical protein